MMCGGGKKNPKIIAFYLPQYHRIPENDRWWGEGFTDWDSARTARPLFRGHYQPRIPLHNYYYDLLDKDVMQWQARLAKKAGIYGFCIYHYWFGKKQLLEKPAENLLKWNDIDCHYCFSWANESWTASWSRLKGNDWNPNGSVHNQQTSNGYLAFQYYGGKKEWKEHFEYLLPFFQDRRYIRKDGMPVFIIYRPQDLRCAAQMVSYWNELAVQNGLKGICFIGTNSSQVSKKKMDAALLYEPVYSIFHAYGFYKAYLKWVQLIRDSIDRMGLNPPKFVSYRMIWRMILNRKVDRDTYYGGFVDFDTSPRKGRYGYVVLKASPRRFKRYFSRLYQKSAREGKEFVFLTAWNEWGEGAYLEPDSKYGFQYLNAVRDIVSDQKRIHHMAKRGIRQHRKGK